MIATVITATILLLILELKSLNPLTQFGVNLQVQFALYGESKLRTTVFADIVESFSD